MTRALLIMVIALAVSLALVSSRLDGVTAERDTARKNAGAAISALEESENNRATEQSRQSVADTEGAVGHEEIERARADAVSADAAGGRLRAEVGRIATQLATCNATAAGERTARIAAVDLLADMLVSTDQRAGELAAIADRARAAGLTCERTYDGVRAAQ